MVNKQKYVLWLPKWFPNPMQHAAGVFILEHARALAKQGNYQVVLLFCKPWAGNHKTEIEREEGITSFTVYYPESEGLLKPLKAILNFRKAQVDAFKAIRAEFGLPSLSHVHVIGRNAALALLNRFKYGIPFVVSAHWSGFLKERNLTIPWYKRWFYKRVVKSAAGGSAVSLYLLSSIQQKLDTNLPNWQVIPNVVKTSENRPAAKDVTIRALHLSLLDTENKQFDKILSAVQAYMLKHPNVPLEFHVFGGKPETVEKHKQTISPVLNEKIIFYSWVNKDSFIETLPLLDFGIFFSKYETQSLAVLECLGAGLPCITANIPAIAEYFNTNSQKPVGLMLNPSTGNIEQAIEQLISQLDTFTTNVKAFNLKPFTEAEIGKKLEAMYLQSNSSK